MVGRLYFGATTGNVDVVATAIDSTSESQKAMHPVRNQHDIYGNVAAYILIFLIVRL